MAQDLEHVTVYRAGTEGYHTYRIPAAVVSTQGTLLAFCEGRKNSARDHGDIDLMLRRSFDGGRTWQPMQLVYEEGAGAEITIGNPCPVVDRTTGTIWLPFCRNNECVFVTHSQDDGATWAPPVEITAQVKHPDWTWYATGPGHGIQLTRGRLLIPCDHRNPKAPDGEMHSHVFFSDDHGSTWQLGGVLGAQTNECDAVETIDGSIYLNMRSYAGKNRRAFAWSTDGGETWSGVALDETLVEPVCQASLIRYTDRRRHDKNRVLFSNPASTKREKMTVRLSYDECRHWHVARTLYSGPSAYSCLVVLPDMTIGCLYERGIERPYEEIAFARFSLEWLTAGADRLT